MGTSAADVNKNFHFLQLPFEGLSHHTVNCIFQDEKGFLWLGTINGLNKYDGYSYQVFQAKENSENALSNNYINSINQDAKENLWVGTKYGLNLYVEERKQFETYLPNSDDPNSISNPNVEIIYKDKKNRMWVGTWGGLSLYREETNDFINYSHDPLDENSLSGDVVTSIMEDSHGRLWIGTAFSGLNMLDLSTNIIKRYKKDATQSNCISGNSISAIYEDEKGQIWVGVEQGGLNRFEEKSQSFKWYLNEEKTNSIASNTVYSIIEDENGELMVGGMNGGISVYNGSEDNFSRYDTYGNYNPFGSKASVFCHYKLKTGEVVIATSNGGVKIQDNYPAAIELFKNVEGNARSLPMDNVSAICEDKSDNYWVGTFGGGLSYFDLQTKQFKLFPAFKDKTVNCLYIDKQDFLWIGTLENGLAKYDPKNDRFTYFKNNPEDIHSINSNLVTTVVGVDNGLWVGTDQGMNLLNIEKEKFTHIESAEYKNKNIELGKINAGLIDYTYKFWVATETGLFSFDEDKNKFMPYDKRNISKDSNQGWISFLYEDRHQHIWINSLDGKVSLLNVNRKPVDITVTNPNYEITGITNVIEDFNGFLWITSRQGLLKCSMNYGNYTIHVLNSFDVNDGLQGELFNNKAGIIGRQSGEILIGGLEGLNVFNPSQLNLNPNAPPVFITDMKVNGKELKAQNQKDISQLTEIDLPKKEAATIDFSFTALNYVKPLKTQYAYKLEGYDENWQYTGNKRMASYANLPAGNYTLKVKASSNDGIWNNHGSSLQINIIPEIWETLGFKLSVVCVSLLVISLGFIGYKKIAKRQVGIMSISDLVSDNHGNGLSRESQDKIFIEKVVKFVESNITNDDLSIEALCNEMGLSRAKLFRDVKKITGKTVSSFIKDIRLEKAKHYLDDNPRSVSEVAYTIGFKSHAHFSRSFKEKFGVSPSAYVLET